MLEHIFYFIIFFVRFMCALVFSRANSDYFRHNIIILCFESSKQTFSNYANYEHLRISVLLRTNNSNIGIVNVSSKLSEKKKILRFELSHAVTFVICGSSPQSAITSTSTYEYVPAHSCYMCSQDIHISMHILL